MSCSTPEHKKQFWYKKGVYCCTNLVPIYPKESFGNEYRATSMSPKFLPVQQRQGVVFTQTPQRLHCTPSGIVQGQLAPQVMIPSFPVVSTKSERVQTPLKVFRGCNPVQCLSAQDTKVNDVTVKTGFQNVRDIKSLQTFYSPLSSANQSSDFCGDQFFSIGTTSVMSQNDRGPSLPVNFAVSNGFTTQQSNDCIEKLNVNADSHNDESIFTDAESPSSAENLNVGQNEAGMLKRCRFCDAVLCKSISKETQTISKDPDSSSAGTKISIGLQCSNTKNDYDIRQKMQYTPKNSDSMPLYEATNPIEKKTSKKELFANYTETKEEVKGDYDKQHTENVWPGEWQGKTWPSIDSSSNSESSSRSSVLTYNSIEEDVHSDVDEFTQIIKSLENNKMLYENSETYNKTPMKQLESREQSKGESAENFSFVPPPADESFCFKTNFSETPICPMKMERTEMEYSEALGVRTAEHYYQCKSCSRTFANTTSFEKHSNVCRKVFGTKLSGKAKSARRSTKETSVKQMPEKQKATLVRRQSEDQNSSPILGAQNTPTRYNNVPSDQWVCPDCNRKFTEGAFECHYPICKKVFAKSGGRLKKGGGCLAGNIRRAGTPNVIKVDESNTPQERRTQSYN